MSDRRARRHEATRREILEAAWTLARAQGLTGWSLREVAAAVDMRAPSLYAYFPSKEAIYDAMFAQGYRELLTQVDSLSREGPPERLLRLAAITFFDFGVADPARFQLLFLRVVPGFTPSAESYALAEEALDRLRAVFHDLGITDPGAVDLATAVQTGLVSQQISNDPGGDRWRRLVERSVDAFLVAEARPRP